MRSIDASATAGTDARGMTDGRTDGRADGRADALGGIDAGAGGTDTGRAEAGATEADGNSEGSFGGRGIANEADSSVGFFTR